MRARILTRMAGKLRQSSSDLSANLLTVSEKLEELGNGHSLPTPQRYVCLRYSPFVRELAKRPEFLRELAAVEVTADTMLFEVIDRLAPFIRQFRLPVAPPYSADGWTYILSLAKVGDPEITSPPTLSIQGIWGTRMELQFVFEGSGLQAKALGGKMPISHLVSFQVHQGRTRKQMRDHLMRICRTRLPRFLPAVRPLAKKVPMASIGIRLLSFTHQPGRQEVDPDNPRELLIHVSPANASLIASFGVSIPVGRRLNTLCAEIVDRLIPALEEIALYAPAQGRPPDTASVARWWAMYALDDLSIESIALPESTDSYDAIDLEDTIARALRRLDIRARTKLTSDFPL